MKRHPHLIPFSHFHRSMLFLSLIAKKNAPVVKGYPTKIEEKIDYALRFYQQEIIPHFEKEQRLIFDAVKEKSEKIDTLIGDLQEERKQLDTFFKALNDNPANIELFHKIGAYIEAHVRKEERVFFQTLQAEFEDQLEQLIVIN